MSTRRWAFALVPFPALSLNKKIFGRLSIFLFPLGGSVQGYTRSDLFRQVRELNDLKQMGELTDEEFADKKKFILDDLK